MACRRRHRLTQIGCHIGASSNGFSDDGRPPSPDKEPDYYDREQIRHWGQFESDLKSRPVEPGREMPPGRTGLHYTQCTTNMRPKFLCAKPGCRRLFKPFYDDTNVEIKVEKGEWRVRPNPKVEPRLKKAMKRGYVEETMYGLIRRWNATDEGSLDAWHDSDKERTGLEVPLPLSDKEKTFLLENVADLWWEDLVSWQDLSRHRKRCPSCGEKGLRIGSNFRVPKKSDEKAWKSIESMIADGQDMAASFEMCPSTEDLNEMIDEVRRRRHHAKHQDQWEDEKKKRWMALGLIKEEKTPAAEHVESN